MLFIISALAFLGVPLASLVVWYANMVAIMLNVQPLLSMGGFDRKATRIVCTLGHLLYGVVLFLAAALTCILARAMLWILSKGSRPCDPALAMVHYQRASLELVSVPRCLTVVHYRSPTLELVICSRPLDSALAMVPYRRASLELITVSRCLTVVRYRSPSLELALFERKVYCSAVVLWRDARRTSLHPRLAPHQMPSLDLVPYGHNSPCLTVALWRDAPPTPRKAIKAIEGPVSTGLVLTFPIHPPTPHLAIEQSICKALVLYTPLFPVDAGIGGFERAPLLPLRPLQKKDLITAEGITAHWKESPASIRTYKGSLLAPHQLRKDLIDTEAIATFWRDRWVSGSLPGKVIRTDEPTHDIDSFGSSESEEESLVTPFASPGGPPPDRGFTCSSPAVNGADWSIAEIFEPLSMPLVLDLSFPPLDFHAPCNCDLCVYHDPEPIFDLQEFEEEQYSDAPNIDTSIDDLCDLFDGLTVEASSPISLTPILDTMSRWSLHTPIPIPIPTIVITPAYVEPKLPADGEHPLNTVEITSTPVPTCPPALSQPKLKEECRLPITMEDLCSKFSKMSTKAKASTSTGIELLTAAFSRWTLHSPSPTTPTHSTPSQAGLGISSHL